MFVLLTEKEISGNLRFSVPRKKNNFKKYININLRWIDRFKKKYFLINIFLILFYKFKFILLGIVDIVSLCLTNLNENKSNKMFF